MVTIRLRQPNSHVRNFQAIRSQKLALFDFNGMSAFQSNVKCAKDQMKTCHY